MINDALKIDILSKILESPQFKDSKRSQELLRYLVQAAIEKKSPKETTIAMEFFGKDPKFDPKEDPTVRVQMNYLRKKLEHYYLTTADPYPYRLEIPKGHYVVQFVPATELKKAGSRSRAAILILSIVTALLSVAILWLLFVRNSQQHPAEKSFAHNPMWAEFFQSTGKPTLIVLGDYYFLFDKSFVSKPGVIVRYPLINSPEDLRAVVRQDPAFAQHYVQSDFTFLRPSASWGIAEILPILKETPHGISLKLASQLTLEDLKAFNVVFIGSFKTLYKLNRILDHFDIQYQLTPTAVTLKALPPDTSMTFYSENVKGGEYERDYAVIVKGLGPEGNTMLLILGFGDSGVLQAAKVVTDPSLMVKIEKEYGKETVSTPFYCNLVIEAEGINQTAFKWALKYFRKTNFPNFPTSGKQTDR